MPTEIENRKKCREFIDLCMFLVHFILTKVALLISFIVPILRGKSKVSRVKHLLFCIRINLVLRFYDPESFAPVNFSFVLVKLFLGSYKLHKM